MQTPVGTGRDSGHRWEGPGFSLASAPRRARNPHPPAEHGRRGCRIGPTLPGPYLPCCPGRRKVEMENELILVRNDRRFPIPEKTLYDSGLWRNCGSISGHLDFSKPWHLEFLAERLHQRLGLQDADLGFCTPMQRREPANDWRCAVAGQSSGWYLSTSSPPGAATYPLQQLCRRQFHHGRSSRFQHDGHLVATQGDRTTGIFFGQWVNLSFSIQPVTQEDN